MNYVLYFKKTGRIIGDMNENALFRWIAEELGTTVAVLHADGSRTYETPPAGKPFYSLEDESIRRFAGSAAISKPHLFRYNEQHLFGCFRDDDHLYLIGPVLQTSGIHPRRSHAGGLIPEDAACPARDIISFSKAIMFLFEVLTGERVRKEDFFLENLLDKHVTHDVETDVTTLSLFSIDDPVGHHSMAPIRKLEGCVREGNVELLTDALNGIYEARFGRTSDDSLRNQKNMVIAGITNVTRAAIEGGLPYQQAYAMSDSYIYRFEGTTDEAELAQLYGQACLHFTKQVAEHKSAMNEATPLQINYYTEKVKRYVSDHIGERIQVADVAEELGVSPNYLSALFKRTEHCTLTDYILKRKINQAKRLLIYSDLSCSDVAFRLGFSSQSHFGASFRRETGMTPHAFAEQNKKVK